MRVFAEGELPTLVPVEGGSANDYDYANQDSCNNYDLDGRNAVSRALDRAAASKWLTRFNKCMATYKKYGDIYKGMMFVGLWGVIAEASNHYEHGQLNRSPFLRNMTPRMQFMKKAAGLVLAYTFAAGYGAYGGQSIYCENRAFSGQSS